MTIVERYCLYYEIMVMEEKRRSYLSLVVYNKKEEQLRVEGDKLPLQSKDES